MHGKAPQKRRRQVKWLTPAQQHEQALRLLRPRPGAREECEFGIRHALAVIQEAKALEKGTPIRKRDRVRLIKQLRAIQDTVRDKPGILGGILDEDGLEQIYWEHALQERLVTEPSRKPRKSRAKRLAAREAFLLLGGHLFSNTGLTEGGT